MTLDEEILDELKKIREAVTPKSTAPPPSTIWGAFTDFLRRTGVPGLAIGFIMGLYVDKVVSALVGDIIMPIPSAFLQEGDLQKMTVTVPVGHGMKFAIGDFVGVIINFLIVAGVIFLIATYGRKMIVK